jgi:hypothetical protein
MRGRGELFVAAPEKDDDVDDFDLGGGGCSRGGVDAGAAAA